MGKTYFGTNLIIDHLPVNISIKDITFEEATLLLKDPVLVISNDDLRSFNAQFMKCLQYQGNPVVLNELVELIFNKGDRVIVANTDMHLWTYTIMTESDMSEFVRNNVTFKVYE